MASHALLADGGAWVVDPTEAPVEDRIRALGEPAGVIQLLDRHERACSQFAERPRRARTTASRSRASPNHVRDRAGAAAPLAGERSRSGGPSGACSVCARRARYGAALLRARRGAARRPSVPRATPPRRWAQLEPDHVLCGHGAGVHEEATAAVRDALARIAPPMPRLLVEPLLALTRTMSRPRSSRTPPRSRAASSSSAAIAASDARGELRDAARRLLRGDAARARPAPTARRRRTRSSLYSVKAFPNVALLRLFAAGGPRRRRLDARRARASRSSRASPGERIVVAREQQERRGARGRGGGRRALRRARRARRGRPRGRGRRAARARARDARHRGRHARGDPHRRTTARSSACRPTRRWRDRRRALRLELAGLHVHIGSQLLDVGAARMTIDWLGAFAADCRAELGWTPRGRRPRRRARRSATSPDEHGAVDRATSSQTLLERLERAWALHELPAPAVILEPGRSLVGRAGRHALPRRRREAGDARRRRTSPSTAACPTTRGRSSTTRATRRCSRTAPTRSRPGSYAVCGKHCESGDVLIERVALPEPRRGDLLAVPATGAYTLAMALELQRAAAPGGGARRRRRGALDPPPRDARRPARARARGRHPRLGSARGKPAQQGSRRRPHQHRCRDVGARRADPQAARASRRRRRRSSSASTSCSSLLTLPLLVAALRALWQAGPRYVAAGIAVGAGASAIATILFTKALFHGDFITVVVLQKAQPLIAVAGAWLILGEQPRPRLRLVPDPRARRDLARRAAAAARPARAGPDADRGDARPRPRSGAWAPSSAATSRRRLEFEHVTTVRFAFGLLASACMLPIVGAAAFSTWHDSFYIALLAFVTGFLALGLYYYGLRRTPAVLAALGELAFPVTAALDRHLRVRQLAALDAMARRGDHGRRDQLPAGAAAPAGPRAGARAGRRDVLASERGRARRRRPSGRCASARGAPGRAGSGRSESSARPRPEAGTGRCGWSGARPPS